MCVLSAWKGCAGNCRPLRVSGLGACRLPVSLHLSFYLSLHHSFYLSITPARNQAPSQDTVVTVEQVSALNAQLYSKEDRGVMIFLLSVYFVQLHRTKDDKNNMNNELSAHS